MTRKHWAAVGLALVVGLGIVVQTARQGDGRQQNPPAAQDTEPTAASDAPVGPYRTIALEVTGMT